MAERGVLIELSHHFVDGSTKIKRMYLKISKSHGKNKAKVAVSREMLKVIYYMLRDNKEFMKG